jgi:hypothetical protein
MKIEWKKVITGVILAFILLLVFAFATVNPSFGFFGFAIAIMYVGYVVGGDLKNGAVHGALTGMVFIIMDLDSYNLHVKVKGDIFGKKRSF